MSSQPHMQLNPRANLSIVNLTTCAEHALTIPGPVAQNMKAQANATQNEFSNLAASRKTPDYTAATGQELTRKTFSTRDKKHNH